MSKFLGFLLGIAVALVGPAIFGVLAADGGIKLNTKEMALAYGIGALIFWTVLSYFSGAAALGAALTFGAMIYTVHWIPNRMTNFLNDVPGVTTGMIDGIKQYTLNGVVPILAVISLFFAIQLIVQSVQRRRRERAEAERRQREQDAAQQQEVDSAAAYPVPVPAGAYQPDSRFGNNFGNSTYDDLFEEEPRQVPPRNQADDQTAQFPNAPVAESGRDETVLVPTDRDETVLVPSNDAAEADEQAYRADESADDVEPGYQAEQEYDDETVVGDTDRDETVVAGDEQATQETPVAKSELPEAPPPQAEAPAAASPVQQGEAPAGPPSGQDEVTEVQPQEAPAKPPQQPPSSGSGGAPQAGGTAPAPQAFAAPQGSAAAPQADDTAPAPQASAAPPATGTPAAPHVSAAPSAAPAPSVPQGAAASPAASTAPASVARVSSRGEEMGQQYRERMDGPDVDDTGEFHVGAFENPNLPTEAHVQAPRVMDLPGTFRPAGA